MESLWVDKYMGNELGRLEKPIAFAKLPLNFELEAISSEIEKLGESQWHMHVNQACFSGSWDVLPLYSKEEHIDAHPILQCFSIEQTDADFIPLPVMKHLPTLANFLEQFQCSLKSIRLMRLQGDSKILPHNDHQVSMEYGEARIHVPISGIDDVDFTVDGQRVPMMRGDVWYMNAHLVHSVSNLGSEPRINLVIDCKVEDWLKNIIKSSEQKF
ncbi:aspartyl/asparaginyl beta-hydroxylase domain-containing protein [Pseudoalteromonas luteoviolacea]|uniref:aspartyl/asparaginyl beta-hydroxylase domain-containing protein n=1 Tax=Pseudoalteromonas luteoviolacea TaxID=43657 RepID=UPI00163B7AD8|nr:aspartyl/asparaginyl beta-hydroxylase domain-containing protein [Pseudoalteromonas luteoviolacea]